MSCFFKGILYEIFTGSPPFYTNSIFQLVNMISKDQVKWPKTMSPEFKNFLQGLLCKDPLKRLTWPDLATHEFIKNDVKSTHLASNPYFFENFYFLNLQLNFCLL
jgi:serine/threonine protein kinase